MKTIKTKFYGKTNSTDGQTGVMVACSRDHINIIQYLCIQSA